MYRIAKWLVSLCRVRQKGHCLRVLYGFWRTMDRHDVAVSFFYARLDKGFTMTEYDANSPTVKEELNALDEMFASSRHYRNSGEFCELMKFIGRFTKYSPYNCLLLYTQNPAVSYVATPNQWFKRFGRFPKQDARPLVILAPQSPVVFVYDLKDTEGKPVPEKLFRPYVTDGQLNKSIFDKTVHNALVHGIDVREITLRHNNGGGAMRLTPASRKAFRGLNPSPLAEFMILLDRNDVLEDKYSVLVHELGHIFCGHLGNTEESWWPDRQGHDKSIVEAEAESIAFLVCRRKGLISHSDKYLSGYLTGPDREVPPVSLYAILKATKYIEDMAQYKWIKPKKTKHKKNENKKE